MNNPEVTMHDTIHNNGLLAQAKAQTAAGLALCLVDRVPGHLRALGDQVVRAASSVPANMAEGHGRFGRDRTHCWRIAYGSAKEVDTLLRLLLSVKAVDEEITKSALDLFDQVRAMTWRLLHPKE